mgnify:CR=1 FL=1
MKHSIPLIALLVSLFGCTSVGVFEKNIAIPDHSWHSNFQPEVRVDITDTTAAYRVYVVIRHTNAYEYNNLWVNLYRSVGADSFPPVRMNLTLASNDKGWLGTGMDDIYEQRVLITSPEGTRFKPGVQTFRIEQIMRRDPLPHVMNAGIRVEKVTQ